MNMVSREEETVAEIADSNTEETEEEGGSRYRRQKSRHVSNTEETE